MRRKALPPAADGRLDRRQRPAHQHRGGDDHAGAHLVVDRQHRAEREQHGLQQDADRLGHAGEDAAAVGGGRLQLDQAPALPDPAPLEVLQHAHGLQGLAVPQAALDHAAQAAAEPAGFLQLRAGRDVVQHAEDRQAHRAAERDQPQQRMQQEHAEHEQRHPQHVQKVGGHRAPDELPDRVEVPQGVVVGRAVGLQHVAERAVDHDLVQVALDGAADPDEDEGSDRLQDRQGGKREDDERGQHDQGGFASARQDAIVDLHHVERRDQDHHIDGQTEDDADGEDLLQSAQDIADGRAGFGRVTGGMLERSDMVVALIALGARSIVSARYKSESCSGRTTLESAS